MKTKPPTLPVLFRADFEDGEVTAVFPTLPASCPFMVCYVHVGQHSECSLGWYGETRAAEPEEYDDLLEELESIYSREDDPERVKLKVYRRMQAKWSKERWS